MIYRCFCARLTYSREKILLSINQMSAMVITLETGREDMRCLVKRARPTIDLAVSLVVVTWLALAANNINNNHLEDRVICVPSRR